MGSCVWFSFYRDRRLALLLAAINLAVLARAGVSLSDDSPPTPTPGAESLAFPDALGNSTEVAPDVLPEHLPAPDQRQVPRARRGTKSSDKRTERLRAGGGFGIEWFSSKQPGLPAYLSSLDEYSNTAVHPGAPFASDPLSRVAQRVKYDFSDYGFNYILAHAFEYVSLTHVPAESQHLGYESYDFFFKQLVFHKLDTGTAGWVSGELYGGAAFGAASRRTTPVDALGSIVDPAASVWGIYGLAVAELAWQQSFARMGVVSLIGVIDQTNYIDTNAYANFSFGQFQNSTFVNSQVLPLSTGNFGLNLQWQPHRDFYAVVGIGPNNNPPGSPPWSQVGGDNMSYLMEAGYAPTDLGGLGPGAYRLQPFVATVDGVTQAGIGLNLNQQLGSDSPFGFFGRFGVGGRTVANVGGASAQAAPGVILQNPLRALGVANESDADFAGLAFVWSQPSANRRPGAHENEYAIETLYVIQITPTSYLTPDVQVIWNPADNRDLAGSLVFQLPLVTTW